MTLLQTRRRFASAVLATLATVAIGAPIADAAETDAWPPFADGTIILFRHAHAPGVGDPRDMRIGDCATQRNLDETGRAQARAIGAAFRERAVVVGRVLTSRWCRAADTAELAFPGQGMREPALDSFFDTPQAGERRTTEARRVLDAWRGPGVLVGVTHQVNIAALTGIAPMSGEGIVLESHNGALRPIGRLRPDGSALRFVR